MHNENIRVDKPSPIVYTMKIKLSLNPFILNLLQFVVEVRDHIDGLHPGKTCLCQTLKSHIWGIC